MILSNKPDAKVIERGVKLKVKTCVFNRAELYESGHVLNTLKKENIDLIVLAGFLWLIPSSLISAFYNRIINIHPALLPKYGGKGMYGMKVHEQVIAGGEIVSGITIHYVNENYDEGYIIFQAECQVSEDETPESLAEKIHKLEYEYYPRVIEEVLIKL